MEGWRGRSFAQDFFFELMRTRSGPLGLPGGAGALDQDAGDRRPRGVLFELEMLLRGSRLLLNLRNLFGEKQPARDRDFREELKARATPSTGPPTSRGG